MARDDEKARREMRTELRLAMRRKVSDEAREDFRKLDEMLPGEDCLQPYELELATEDLLAEDRWEHVRGCAACELMLEGARIPAPKRAAATAVPAEISAAIGAGVDGALWGVSRLGASSKPRVPALAACLGGLTLGVLATVLVLGRERGVATPDGPTAADLLVRLQRESRDGQPYVEFKFLADPGLEKSPSAYLDFARAAKDRQAWSDAAFALCIAENLSLNDPKAAAKVRSLIKEVDAAASAKKGP